jgi:hypothetical protein
MKDADLFDLSVDLTLCALANAIIRDALTRDPDRVARVVASIVECLKRQGRYGEDEIDLAVNELRQDLDLRPSLESADFRACSSTRH